MFAFNFKVRPYTMVEETQPSQAPMEEEEEAVNTPAPDLDGGAEAVRSMVAALKTGLGFSLQLGGAVGILCRLLASSTSSDGRHSQSFPSQHNTVSTFGGYWYLNCGRGQNG